MELTAKGKTQVHRVTYGQLLVYHFDNIYLHLWDRDYHDFVY